MIAIIEGCGTNITSIQFALERLGQASQLTTDPKFIKKAERVILPGVGTAHHAMQNLQQLNLVEVITQLTQPVLGICLGMQLLYEFSEEGNVPCLGIVPNKIMAIPTTANMPLPHMGWNQLQIKEDTNPLIQGIHNNDYVYFVHSFAAPVDSNTIAFAEYGMPFTAMVQKNNFFGAQFHPERSGKVGLKILENFLRNT